MSDILCDPYEEQLLDVFNTCDLKQCGSLDKNELVDLCSILQLENQSSELVYSLLTKPNKDRVSFYDFKEALLTLLKNTHIVNENDTKTEKKDRNSPDREVLPKFVYGAKKYGRRSRPGDNILVQSPDDSENEINNRKDTQNKVKRSNSQSDVHTNKYRNDLKLKRCTSFPNSTIYTIDDNVPLDKDSEFDTMQRFWKYWRTDENGYMNCDELLKMCEYTGMDKSLLDILKDSFSVERMEKINFETFMKYIQINDETKQKSIFSENHLTDGHDVIQNYIPESTLLNLNSYKFVSSDIVTEMWENAGISDASSLLNELGFVTEEIDILKLDTVLEEELYTIVNSTPVEYSHVPPVSIFKALLSLYHYEIQSLKTVIEQTVAERDKLKNNIFEANQRAQFLAQEIDDNHAKMEKASKERIQQLEYKYGETIKELSEQLTNEKEHTAKIVHGYEKRILQIESEDVDNKARIVSIQSDVTDLEKDKLDLKCELEELKETNMNLVQKVKLLEKEKRDQSILEGTRESEMIEMLLSEIKKLSNDSTVLRDQNDELCITIENMKVELSTIKNSKHDYIDSVNSVELVQNKTCSDELSETLKIQQNQQDVVDQFNNYTENDQNLFNLMINDLIGYLVKNKSYIDVKQNINSSNDGSFTEQPIEHKLLLKIIDELNNHITNSNNDLVPDKIDSDIIQKKYKTATARCNELEDSLELMRQEYELCEDYWQKKLEEERQLFESEQKQSDLKLQELLTKMTVLEEQFTNQSKLPIIEENSYEKQFTDLEEELESYKIYSEQTIEAQNQEIDELKKRLSDSSLKSECLLLKEERDSLKKEVGNLQDELTEEPVYYYKWKGLRSYAPTKGSKQTCRVSIGTIQDLNARLCQLDVKNRHLQQQLCKQQKQTESALHQYWLQHKGETETLQCVVKKLQFDYDRQLQICDKHLERLSKADLLVKDLYIENSYLIATIQRLDKSYHISSAQCNNINSNVTV